MAEQQQYMAMWSFSNRKGAHRATFMAENLNAVMRLLNKSEGVSTHVCEEIVVHQLLGGGKVAEVYSYDRAKDETRFDFSVKSEETINGMKAANVHSIVDAQLKKSKEESKVKPHVKLTLDKTKAPARPFVKANFGRYTAYEATPNG